MFSMMNDWLHSDKLDEFILLNLLQKILNWKLLN